MRTIYGINQHSKLTFTDGGWSGGPIEDLGVLDGRHFFSLDDETLASLPTQPAEADFAPATTNEKTALKKASPFVKAIYNDIAASIRAKYTLEQELRAHRVGDNDVLTDIGNIADAGSARVTALGF